MPIMRHPSSPGLAIFIAALFVATALTVVFASHADAQTPLTSPREACQFYQSRWEKGLLAVVRDTENECLVRVGDNNTGFGYIRGYYSGNQFCLDSSGAYFNNAGLPDSSECIIISQSGRQQQQDTSRQTALPLVNRVQQQQQPQQNIPIETALPLVIGGGIILGIIMVLVKRKQIFRPQEKKSASPTVSVTKEKKKK